MIRPIASITLLGKRDSDSEPFRITVEIGAPFEVEGQPGEWACYVGLEPLYKKLRDARSNDPLQSLCLAISLAIDLLAGFQKKGGELFFETGDPFPLEAYCFGAALGRGNAA